MMKAPETQRREEAKDDLCPLMLMGGTLNHFTGGYCAAYECAWWTEHWYGDEFVGADCAIKSLVQSVRSLEDVIRS